MAFTHCFLEYMLRTMTSNTASIFHGQAREKGRAAFKAQQWNDAVSYFTIALQTNPSDIICLSVRSSAYQKLGQHEEALADAHQTIQIDPTYVRGYIRKACVLRAMKEYTQEVDNYLVGLEHCPGNESLMRGLQGAQRLKLYSSKASQAAKISQATKLAALSRRQKASQATNLKAFVEQTQKNMELEALTIQAQLELIHEMNRLVESENLDLVHSWLLAMTTPKISTLYDVVVAIQKAAAVLPFGDEVHQALDRVTYQSLPESLEEKSGKISRAGLETFLRAVVNDMNITLACFLQFIVGQILFPGVSEPCKLEKPHQQPSPQVPIEAQELPQTPNNRESASAVQDRQVESTETKPSKSVLNDTRMQHLFILFDKDSDATVDFKEVALGLYPLTKNIGEAAKKAAGLLLMVDRNDQRELSYEQFARLILAVAAAFGMTFDELADQLTYELAQPTGPSIDSSAMEEIIVVEEAYTKAFEERKEQDQRKKTIDALSYTRTQKLFQLWDENDDGTIDFSELLHGLRRYQKAVMGNTSLAAAERDALMIMGHDDDHNQTLDPEEFGYAMFNFAERIGTTLHELIDFLCVVSSGTTQTLEYETKLAETMRQARLNEVKYKPNMGTILDSPDDGGEENNDAW